MWRHGYTECPPKNIVIVRNRKHQLPVLLKGTERTDAVPTDAPSHLCSIVKAHEYYHEDASQRSIQTVNLQKLRFRDIGA